MVHITGIGVHDADIVQPLAATIRDVCMTTALRNAAFASYTVYLCVYSSVSCSMNMYDCCLCLLSYSDYALIVDRPRHAISLHIVQLHVLPCPLLLRFCCL